MAHFSSGRGRGRSGNAKHPVVQFSGRHRGPLLDKFSESPLMIRSKVGGHSAHSLGKVGVVPELNLVMLHVQL